MNAHKDIQRSRLVVDGVECRDPIERAAFRGVVEVAQIADQ